MTITVPYLSRRRIELSSQLLLEEFQARRQTPIVPPIPVEEIVELHLGLTLAIRPLREVFGIEDVLGAIWFDSCEVVIDEHLDPEVHPDLEGRFRFTLAHEVGHWQLHRGLCSQSPAPDSQQPGFLCRTSQARARVEWQADYFAAALLVPRLMVTAVWQTECGPAPLLLTDLVKCRDALLESEIARCGLAPQSEAEEVNYLLNAVAAPLAVTFHVSVTAMRIRLEHLGLLLRGPA